jgi:hypothetical protein
MYGSPSNGRGGGGGGSAEGGARRTCGRAGSCWCGADVITCIFCVVTLDMGYKRGGESCPPLKCPYNFL